MDLNRGEFYLGRSIGDEQPVVYEADNLTTHGVIVGMTGSGKTGLGIDLVEEAALNGIPTLVIDPKGDMGNLLLNFPDFDAASFEPWVDVATAKKEGISKEDLAQRTADLWRNGLNGDNIESERLKALKDSSDMTIYTPGSNAGIPLNVLGSMSAPALDWATHGEVIRDEIEALVSSLLVLAGIESDPMSGAEHILLATIIETWWKQGKDIDLASLIGQIPHPPFRKLGVFEVDAFFPEKRRMELALQLNGLLASPSFAAWLEGEPLDIQSMIGNREKTQIAIIYISHLSDAERQFLVTLLLSKMVTWIRAQPGTSELRALIYMDEVFGFAPPTAEPPSKKPILTILKQARAHGVGMVLSTQNPVDLDYKAMSNAGTWLIGRLQTENDKRRILEGMKSATGDVDIETFDHAISNLEKRQFVLHSIKASSPMIFDTRWAMSYLAGPLTRDQVSSLMADRRTEPPAIAERQPTADPQDTADGFAPKVAEGRTVRFMDPAAPWAATIGADPTGSLYEAGAAVTVQVLYDDTKAGVNHSEVFEGILFPLDGVIDPTDLLQVDHDGRDFRSEAPEGARFAPVDTKLENKTFWTGVESDVKTHLVAHQNIEVHANHGLKLFSRVGEDHDAFVARCRESASEKADSEMAKLRDKYEARIDRVEDQIRAAQTRIRELEGDASARQQDELLSGAGDLLGAFLGGRKSSNPLGKAASRRAATQKAQARVDAAADRLTDRNEDLADLEEDLSAELTEIRDRYSDMAESFEPMEIGLEKTDIRIVDLKMVWIPVS